MRTEHRIATLVEQRGVHGRRGRVDEAFAVEGVEQRLALQRVQGQGWASARRTHAPGPHERRTARAGLLARRCATPQAHGVASSAHAQVRGEFVDAGHQVLPVLSSGVANPSSKPTFFEPR